MSEVKMVTPPNSKESEMLVLGCMITSIGSLNIAAGSLDEQDFFYTEHKSIFKVLKGCYIQDKPADVHLVAEELKRLNLLKAIGGVGYLTTIAQYAGTAAHIEEYTEKLKNKSLSRQILEIAKETERAVLKDPANPSELLQEISKKTVDLGKRYSPNDKASIGEILSGKKSRISAVPLIQRLRERQEYFVANKEPFMTAIPTGFAGLDSKVTLLEPTNFIIIAARPAMGKTALALNIASNICFEQGRPVAIISLEMGADQLAERLISMRTGIPGESLKRGSFGEKDLQKILEEHNTLMHGRLFIHDQNCSSISQLVFRARRLKDENDIELLIIDYLQLLGTNGGVDSRQYEVAEVSRRLKSLAMELQIPVVCVAQLSRKVEERVDKRPLLSDLRDSGQIEQDSDAVLFIYREDYYTQDKSNENGTAEVYLGKNRHGGTPSILLQFDKGRGLFKNLPDEARGIHF